MTAAAWGQACLPCAANTVADAGATACTTIALPTAPKKAAAVFTLARPSDGLLSVAGSAQNGTLWIGCSGGDVVMVRPPPFSATFWDAAAVRLRGVLPPSAAVVSMALTRDEASLYVYDASSGVLARVQSQTQVVVVAVLNNSTPDSMMCVALTGRDAVEEHVFWKSAAASISSWPAATAATTTKTFEFDAEDTIAAFAAHPDGGLIVMMRQARRLWRLWPTTGGVFPITADVPFGATGMIACCWEGSVVFAVGRTIWVAGAILAGNASSSSSSDNLGGSARLESPLLASAVLVTSTSGGGGSLLLFVDAGAAIRAVYSWDDAQCGLDTYYYYNAGAGYGACLPCPQGTHAAAGALACTVCPPDEYYYVDRSCVPCPTRGWWRYDDAALSGCRPMQDTLPVATTAFAAQLMTFANAVQQIQFLKGKKLQCDFPLASLLPLASADLLQRGDLLGRFWRVDSDDAARPDDPAGVAEWATPALWLYCCSPQRSASNVCVCEFGPSTIMGAPWDALRRPSSSLYAMCGGGAFQIDAGSGSIEISIAAGAGDTVACWVGWPTSYTCASPAFAW